MPAPGSPEAAAQYEPLPVPSPDELLAQGRMAVFARDYADALRLFRQAATAGSARALSAIGDLHERGFGVARSDREATVWYRKAIAAGDAQGQARIGFMLVRSATPADVQLGVAMIRQAVAKGDAFGRFVLATLYMQGRAVPRDDAMAATLLEAASAQGEPSAQSLLGQMYLEGRGVPMHAGMALMLLTEAARQGDTAAQNRLGALFRKGWGIERDEQEAAYWRKPASRATTRRAPTSRCC